MIDRQSELMAVSTGALLTRLCISRITYYIFDRNLGIHRDHQAIVSA